MTFYSCLPRVLSNLILKQGDRLHAQQLGATDYVVKPITYREMQRFMATLEGFLRSLQPMHGITGG